MIDRSEISIPSQKLMLVVAINPYSLKTLIMIQIKTLKNKNSFKIILNLEQVMHKKRIDRRTKSGQSILCMKSIYKFGLSITICIQ